jgi:hypothetical protein
MVVQRGSFRVASATVSLGPKLAFGGEYSVMAPKRNDG